MCMFQAWCFRQSIQWDLNCLQFEWFSVGYGFLWVSCMAGSSNLDSFRDGRQMAE